MIESKQIYSFRDPWYLKRIIVERECDGCELTLELTMSNDDNEQVVILKNPKDEDVVSSLLDAERIVIAQELDTQREYGTIRVECFSESYFEFWCDSAV